MFIFVNVLLDPEAFSLVEVLCHIITVNPVAAIESESYKTADTTQFIPDWDCAAGVHRFMEDLVVKTKNQTNFATTVIL